MRTLRIVALLSLAPLLALPAAAAHVTVKATAPPGALPVDQPTEIAASVSGSCATVLAEYNAMSKNELNLQLDKSAPAWLASTKVKVPFNVEDCDPSTQTVVSNGKFTVTPGALAPGLQTVNITVVASFDGTTPEGGDVAVIPVTVAYGGALNASTSVEMAMLDHEDGTATIEVVLNASTNADSMLMFEVLTPPALGTLEGLPSSDTVTSPLADNLTSREIRYTVTYTSSDPENMTEMEMVEVRVLMHAAADPSLMTEPQTVMLHFMPAEHDGHDGEHDHSTHDHDEGGTVPGLEPALLLLAIAGLALFARRRA